MNKFQILVVEDDAPIRNLIATTLKTHNYKYLLAQNEVLTEDTEYTDKVIIHALFSEEDKELRHGNPSYCGSDISLRDIKFYVIIN